MLDYEWGTPSTVMLSPDNDPDNSASDPTPHHHHHHHQANIFDHYANPQSSASAFNNLIPPPPPQPPASHQHIAAFSSHFNPAQVEHLQSLYDPHPYAGASTYAPSQHHHHHSLLAMDPIHGAAAHGLMLVPKTEDLCPPVDFASRIGLNLGGRTYFSSEDDFMNRLYRRTRPGIDSGSTHSPRCQAEGCTADLSHAKHYHRRHKVCEFHSKASTVIANGLTQRFCQQCSRFHLLSEFDNGKRSCRKRLADHNRRRRKTQQTNNQDNPLSLQPPPETTRNSSSDNAARSPSELAAHSASSVTVAVSPPRMTLDCFRQRPYQSAATTSSGSSSSLFFSSG